jgi:anti-sigma factor ChrR (cupin superfamily)
MKDDPERVLELHALFQNSQWQRTLQWQPFFPGVEIHRLYESGPDGPRAALLRFHPGGCVPLHRHVGYEHIVVLEGEQMDENGKAAKGALIINPPGTSHSVSSEHGCIVLAIYEKPVKFLLQTGT